MFGSMKERIPYLVHAQQPFHEFCSIIMGDFPPWNRNEFKNVRFKKIEARTPSY
jgi:hypothetical protein